MFSFQFDAADDNWRFIMKFDVVTTSYKRL
jgi:hypothetical protein